MAVVLRAGLLSLSVPELKRKNREAIDPRLPLFWIPGGTSGMVQRISHTGIFVLDQEAAKDFYVNKLGFEVRIDVRMDTGFRWLTVGPKTQPDLSLILMQVDGPNMPEDVARAMKQFLQEGKIGGGVLQTADCRKTYEELKAKGVEFLKPPQDQFYGVEALMKDNSGNWFSLTEPKGS
jgi:catechol 2,3-dioxygenase-like lactoylglutathione lyase family enzyme